MGDPVIYARSRCDVVAAWHDAKAEEAAHEERLNAWLDTLTPPGRERRGLMVTRPAWGAGQTKIVGLKPYPRERPEDYPLGWRRRAADGWLTPYRAETRGVPAAAAEAACHARQRILALAYPVDIRRRLPAFGMPDRVMSSSAIHIPGVLLHQGAVYCRWNVPAIVLETGKDEHGHQHSRHPSDMVDLGRWERVPLSRWYAIVEALDGEKATTGSH
jgi:hypothetical protein